MRWLRVTGVGLVVALVAAAVWVFAPVASAQVLRVDQRGRLMLGPQVRIFEGTGSVIGVTVKEAEQGSGVVVETVEGGSPAEKAGIKAGDAIVEFDGERVRSTRHLTRLVRETPPGRAVRIAVTREGRRLDLTVTPEERRLAPGVGEMLGDILRWVPDLERNFRFEQRDWTLRLPPDRPGAPLLERYFSGVGSAGRLGVTVQDLNSQLAAYFGVKEGVLVTEVRDGSPASKAGLKAGDVITAANGRPVRATTDLTQAVRETKDGTDIALTFMRDRKELTLKARIEGPQPARRVVRGRIIV